MATTEPEGRPGRWRMLLGHYNNQLGMAGLAMAGVTFILVGSTGWGRSVAGAVTAVLIAVAAVVAITASALTWRYHDRGLCSRCDTVTAALDPEGAVAAARRRLALFHRTGLRAAMVVVFLILAVVNVAATAANVPGVGYATIAYGLLAVVTEMTVQAAHRRLAPWCPWCRHGGGWGDDAPPEVVPDPQPTGKVPV